MTPIAILAGALALGLVIVAAAAFFRYRSAIHGARQAWLTMLGKAEPGQLVFAHASLSGLPEIARRYFAHAIAEGTVLKTLVEIEMHGTFLLGNKSSARPLAMTARQILCPPSNFIWMAKMERGPMHITGSDALVDGVAWTRFWLQSLIPVVNAHGGDVARSAAFRSAMESIWVPPSLLPDNGVRWEQTGADTARVTFERITPEIALDLTIAADGAVTEIEGLRWSDENPERQFRLQPFGGTIDEERTFAGYTIPSRLAVGNLFGTPAYVPFFQAEVLNASYH